VEVCDEALAVMLGETASSADLGFNVGCVNVSLPFRKRFDRAYVRAGPQRGKTGQGPGQGMSAFHRM